MTSFQFPVDGWRTATASNEYGGECVEVNYPRSHPLAGVRDSKSPTAGTLMFTAAAWTGLQDTLRAGTLAR